MNQISLTRIQAIFMKDYREFSRNYAISIMVLMPIVMAILFKNMETDSTMIMLLITSLTLGLVTTFIQACFIAEEKEYNTLRNLLLSPASLMDILLGKSLLVVVISAVSLGVSYYIVSFVPTISFVIALVLCLFFYSALGTIAGLFADSTMEATFTIIPFVIIFPFSSDLQLLESKFSLFNYAKWLPSSQLAEIAQGNDVGIGFVIILLWLIVSWVVAIILCRKRMVD